MRSRSPGRGSLTYPRKPFHRRESDAESVVHAVNSVKQLARSPCFSRSPRRASYGGGADHEVQIRLFRATVHERARRGSDGFLEAAPPDSDVPEREARAHAERVQGFGG